MKKIVYSSHPTVVKLEPPDLFLASLFVGWLAGSSVFQCFCMDCVILVLRSHQNFPGPSSGQDGKPPRLSRVSVLRFK